MVEFDEMKQDNGDLLVTWRGETQGEWERALCAFKTMIPAGKRRWNGEKKRWLVDNTALDIYEELKLAFSDDQGTEILSEIDKRVDEQLVLKAAKQALRWRGGISMQRRAIFAIRAAMGIINVPVGYSLSKGVFGAWNKDEEVWFYEDGRYSGYSPSDVDKRELSKAYERMALAYRRYSENLEHLDDELPSISFQQQLRLDMLEKYDYQCYVCEMRPDNLRNLHMHRIVPGKRGGTYVEENVVILCRKHHHKLEGLDWDAVHKAKEKYADELECAPLTEENITNG